MVEMKIPFDYDNATEEERKEFQKFLWEHPEYDNLDPEEMWYEEHSDEFVPCENQEELRRQLMEAASHPAVLHGTFRLPEPEFHVLENIAKQKGITWIEAATEAVRRYIHEETSLKEPVLLQA